MSHQNLHPRLDNTHVTFVNCLRNWDDPFLNGYKPTKSVGCMRCDGCGCRLNTQNGDPQLDANTHKTDTISSNCSSSSENSHCTKLTNSFGSNAHLNSSGLSGNNRHYLCNTHSNLNRNLSVSNLSHRSAGGRAEMNLHPSKIQPIVR